MFNMLLIESLKPVRVIYNNFLTRYCFVYFGVTKVYVFHHVIELEKDWWTYRKTPILYLSFWMFIFNFDHIYIPGWLYSKLIGKPLIFYIPVFEVVNPIGCFLVQFTKVLSGKNQIWIVFTVYFVTYVCNQINCLSLTLFDHKMVHML